MTSQEQAQALRELDRLYEQKDSFRVWLAGNQQSQGDIPTQDRGYTYGL